MPYALSIAHTAIISYIISVMLRMILCNISALTNTCKVWAYRSFVNSFNPYWPSCVPHPFLALGWLEVRTQMLTFPASVQMPQRLQPLSSFSVRPQGVPWGQLPGRAPMAQRKLRSPRSSLDSLSPASRSHCSWYIYSKLKFHQYQPYSGSSFHTQAGPVYRNEWIDRMKNPKPNLTRNSCWMV